MDKTQLVIDIFNFHAQAYWQKYQDISLYHNSIDIFCNELAPGAAPVLELACGPGNVTRYLLEKRPEIDILGIDIADLMVELARINNPQARFEVMDCREIGQLPQRFEGIMAGFCLPYLSRPEVEQLFRDAALLLLPDGLLYLSTMEDDYEKSGWEGTAEQKLFMHYHTAEHLSDHLKQHGFEILHLSRAQYTDKRDKAVTDLMMVARKVSL